MASFKGAALYGLLLATGVLGAVIPSTHEVHEKREMLHSRWGKGRRVSPGATMPMRIALAQEFDMERAEEHLMDVSHPDSPNFAKYWTPDEVTEAFRPSDETVAAVRQWLAEAGIHEHRITHSDNLGWLAFDATGAEADSLLHTEFHEYHDKVTGGKIPGCDAYRLPSHIRKHVDFVSPGIKLIALEGNQPSAELKKRADPGHSPVKFTQAPDNYLPQGLQTCDQAITPQCVAALYKIPQANMNEKPVEGNHMGIFESEAQLYSQEDSDLFFRNFTPSIPKGTGPTFISIDGGPGPTKNVTNAGGETDLDFQLAYPIVYPQQITQYQVDDQYYESLANDTYTFGFNTFLDALDGSYCTYSAFGETGDASIDPQYPDPRPGGYKGKLQCGVYKPTNVISVSYGGQEADVPASYQKRQCNEYLKLGLQGVSIFFASGDAGVGNYPAQFGGDDNPETGCLGSNGLLFNPTWPNTCPYITNVGATKVYPGKTVNDPESAVNDPANTQYPTNYSSGGGFSNLYAIPKYQQAAVAAYFADHSPPYKSYSKLANSTDEIATLPGNGGGVYNRIGRGVPDVAANGDNIAVYDQGRFGLSGGTSASTPIFAAIVTRINEERLRAGKKTVGFMNPTLYSHPEVLNDIVNGSNPGCWTEGFSAVKGWDPVTGLGTPNFPKMLDLYMGLP